MLIDSSPITGHGYPILSRPNNPGGAETECLEDSALHAAVDSIV